MFDLIIGAITALLAINVVGIASSNGYLGGVFSRSFAGIATQITSSTFLVQYTNTETFILACVEGYLGTPGYLFIGSLFLLIIVWVNNLIEYRTAIM
jgi:hypothetical protein